jgi:hypothetical protein
MVALHRKMHQPKAEAILAGRQRLAHLHKQRVLAQRRHALPDAQRHMHRMTPPDGRAAQVRNAGHGPLRRTASAYPGSTPTAIRELQLCSDTRHMIELALMLGRASYSGETYKAALTCRANARARHLYGDVWRPAPTPTRRRASGCEHARLPSTLARLRPCAVSDSHCCPQRRTGARRRPQRRTTPSAVQRPDMPPSAASAGPAPQARAPSGWRTRCMALACRGAAGSLGRRARARPRPIAVAVAPADDAT